MTERAAIDSTSTDHPEFFRQAFRSNEGGKLHRTVANTIIDHPERLKDFLHAAGELKLEAEVHADSQQTRRYTELISAVISRIATYPWVEKRGMDISPDTARELLLSLAPARRAEKQRRRFTLEERIVQGLVKGYLNDRFEDKKHPDWRGSLATQERFLAGAVLGETSLAACEMYLDIVAGCYPEVLPAYGVGKRAMELGYRMVDPKDEEHLKRAYNIRNASLMLARLFGREDIWSEDPEESNVFRYRFDALGVLVNRGEVKLPLDRKDLEAFQRLIKNPANLELYAQDFGPINQIKAALPPTADLEEVVSASLVYKDRFTAITSSKILSDRTIAFSETLSPEQQSLVTRINLGSSEIQEAVARLIPRSRREPYVIRAGDRVQDELGTSWQRIPFATEDVEGIAFIPADPNRPWDRTVVSALETFRRLRIRESWQAAQAQGQGGAFVWWSEFDKRSEGGYFIVTKEGINKSPLELLLDTKVANIYRESLLYKILNDNVELSRFIPGHMTRFPTNIGDIYRLKNHPQGNGIDNVRIYIPPDGPLSFTITFVNDHTIYPSGETPVLAGRALFGDGPARLVFEEDRERPLPPDLRWVLEKVVLELVKKSCCRDPEEIEKEVEKLQAEIRTGEKRSLPGRIGLIGVRRKTGEPGRFTRIADEKYQDKIKGIFGARHPKFAAIGLDLATVNANLRQPGDDRYYTYFAGDNADALQQTPTEGDPPDHLLPE